MISFGENINVKRVNKHGNVGNENIAAYVDYLVRWPKRGTDWSWFEARCFSYIVCLIIHVDQPQNKQRETFYVKCVVGRSRITYPDRC